MFSYNCEKCGREVPPAYSECPDCAAKAGATTPAAVAEPVAAPPPVAVAAPAAAPPPVAAQPIATQPVAPPPPVTATPPPAYAVPAPPRPQPNYAPRPSAGTPGWVIALLVASVLVLGGYVLVDKGLPWYRARNNPGLAFETPSTPVASESAAAAAAPALPDATKFLEVTGLRLTEANRKPQITMAVVNHAAAELTDIRVNVVVRTTKDRPGDAPLANLELKLGSIGANEVRDVTMPFPTKLRAYELPDWQFLTAEVRAK